MLNKIGDTECSRGNVIHCYLCSQSLNLPLFMYLKLSGCLRTSLRNCWYVHSRLFLEGVSPSPHGFGGLFFPFLVCGWWWWFGLVWFCIAARRTSTRGGRGLTKRSWNWPKTFDHFLAPEKGRNFLLLRIVIAPLFPKPILSWAAVCLGSSFVPEELL